MRGGLVQRMGVRIKKKQWGVGGGRVLYLSCGGGYIDLYLG